MTWLDPRRTLDRLYAGTGRIQRALEFVEFLEAQEPVIIEAQNSLFGFRRRIRNARRRLVSLGVSVLVVGAVLYVVLAYPDDTAADPARSEMPYTLGPLGPAGGPVWSSIVDARAAHAAGCGSRGLVPG